MAAQSHPDAPDVRHRPISPAEAGAARHASPSTRAQNVFSFIAAGALALLFALAFLNDARPSPADLLTLLALGLLGIAFFWTPLFRVFDSDSGRSNATGGNASDDQATEWGNGRRSAELKREEASAFALSLAMCVVYGMARASGPNGEKVWSLHFALLPTTEFPVSWAARVVVAGAIVTAPLWIRHMHGWTRAVLCALGIITFLGIASFSFLRGYYPMGEVDAVLDPKPLTDTIIQVVEYGALALLCCAACAVPNTRRLVLRVLPLLLLALWARHQWFPAPPPPEEDE